MPNNLIKNFKYGDRVILIVFLSLCVISIITLFSASSSLAYSSREYTAPILRHVFFILGGIAVAGFIYFLPQQIVRIAGYLGLAVSVILLFYLAFFVHGEDDSSRWIDLGIFRFQPSEIAKLSLIIVVADLLSRIKESESERKYFWIIVVFVATICILVMISNLSTALIIGAVMFAMMFVANINWKYLLGIIGTLLIIALSGYGIAHKMVEKNIGFSGPFRRVPTWVNRVDHFFEAKDNEQKFDKNAEGNYQPYYSQLAVARGSKSPIGVLPGNSVERDYLPQAFDDYVFAILVEESGIIGALFITLLYFLIIFRGGMLAYKSESSYVAILAMGISMMITFQAIVSMMVCVGIIPVTGQPLPMISRGGTSVIITSAYFGILLGISRVQNGKRIAAETVRRQSEENIPIVDIDEIEE